MMYRETSSEESDQENSDGGSDYEVSERSDGDVDDDDDSLENKAINTRTRAKSVMISIPEATKMRPRNSGISIREPTDSPILVDSLWQQRRQRNTPRLPAQRFNNPIVASSSSSSAANIVPVAVSSQAQVNNVSGGSITTSLISQVNASTGNIITSLESGLNPSSSSIQDYFFGSSSSGSNIKRPSRNSASDPIPTNTFPFPLGLSNASVQAHANITRQMTSSSQPWLSLAMPNYPSSMHGRGLTQHYLRGMVPIAAAMQRPYGLRNQPPLLQHERGLDLNQSANEDNKEKKVEEEDESLDLNQPANEDDDDGKKDEGLDLNQPAMDV